MQKREELAEEPHLGKGRKGWIIELIEVDPPATIEDYADLPAAALVETCAHYIEQVFPRW
jgi:hypothetical protein